MHVCYVPVCTMCMPLVCRRETLTLLETLVLQAIAFVFQHPSQPLWCWWFHADIHSLSLCPGEDEGVDDVPDKEEIGMDYLFKAESTKDEAGPMVS